MRLELVGPKVRETYLDFNHVRARRLPSDRIRALAYPAARVAIAEDGSTMLRVPKPLNGARYKIIMAHLSTSRERHSPYPLVSGADGVRAARSFRASITLSSMKKSCLPQ